MHQKCRLCPWEWREATPRRLLDALEKKYREDHRQMAKVLSFEEYGKEGHADV